MSEIAPSLGTSFRRLALTFDFVSFSPILDVEDVEDVEDVDDVEAVEDVDDVDDVGMSVGAGRLRAFVVLIGSTSLPAALSV